MHELRKGSSRPIVAQTVVHSLDEHAPTKCLARGAFAACSSLDTAIWMPIRLGRMVMMDWIPSRQGLFQAGAAAVFLGLVLSLLVGAFAIRRSSWQLLALAAGLSTPAAFLAHTPYATLLLLPYTLLAAAVAFRWNVGRAGWLGLLLVAVAIWFVGGAAVMVLDSAANRQISLVWVLIVGLLLGFAALALKQSPWASNGSGN